MPTWPVTVHQLDNYARRPVAHLPALQIAGLEKPVVQVYEDKTGELVYGLRLNERNFRPPVFALGRYTVKVGDPDAGKLKTIPGLEAVTGNQTALEVKF
jgi:hypothetical protein